MPRPINPYTKVIYSNISCRERGICSSCHRTPRLPTYSTCGWCLLIRRVNSAKGLANKEARCVYAAKRSQQYKQTVIDHYGGKCCVCGEARLPCLQVDHIYGDGKAHRSTLGWGVKGGTHFYCQLVNRNEYPNTLQVLCANCHQLKHTTRRWA